MTALRRVEAFAALPQPWAVDLLRDIRHQLAHSRRKLVVLDDDPTGTQTVRDVPVITRWDADTLQRELRSELPCFYVLTNSRSLPAAAVEALMGEIGAALRDASAATGTGITVVSRSDSTLRGHFPVETDALARELGPFTATVIMPYFEEGGRYTLESRHYVAEGEALVPAAETPFARDASFGYRYSDLPAWVEEKTGGRVPAHAVKRITIHEVRRGPEHVARLLMALPHGSVSVVDACDPRDAQVVALSTMRAEEQGGRFMFRTAASFVSARLGLERVPLWRPEQTGGGAARGGLVVVGSYVPKTTAQLEQLRHVPELEWVELRVGAILQEGGAASEVAQARAAVDRLLAAGRDVVLFTSRDLVVGRDVDESLAIGRRVSEALVAVVAGLAVAPRFLVAKGGITSSDVATRALNVARAWVLGAILPGVPVWRLGGESRFPGLDYVVFPGNVGAADALAEVVAVLRDDRTAAVNHRSAGR
jgi:uncharacterized protein YgbK (DUF1537 family)